MGSNTLCNLGISGPQTAAQTACVPRGDVLPGTVKLAFDEGEGIFDIQAVENSIDNIIRTDPGQKILNPKFGLDLKEFIFPEKFDDYYAWKMETKIWDELPGQELRIIVQSVKVRANPEDRAWNVAITYDVEALKAYNLTWAAILKGGVFTRVEAPQEVYEEIMENPDDDPLNSCICSLPVEQKMLEPPI